MLCGVVLVLLEENQFNVCSRYADSQLKGGIATTKYIITFEICTIACAFFYLWKEGLDLDVLKYIIYIIIQYFNCTNLYSEGKFAYQWQKYCINI